MATMPNFAGIKCSRPDAQMIRKLIETADKKVAVLVGNEAIALGSLAMGATGLISGLATAVPEPFVALTKAVADNDLATAQDWQNRINRALACFPAGMRLGGVKSILQARGIAVGNTIPPRPMPTTTDLWQQIAEIIERI
jgi:dihydrodipicolinate synthase/N-acetylneuraminate lyase